MISVIVPVHNVKKYIIQCLDSIEKQTYKEIEIICVDSSDDGTTDILRDYAGKYSNIIHVIDKNNSYGYKLNYGIHHASGEYLGIIDADDWILPDMYEELLAVLLREETDFVKSDYYQFYSENGQDVVKEYTGCMSLTSCYSKKTSIEEHPEILYRKGMSIWTGLYKISYLLEKNICANESAGASYQDAGFSALSHILADTFYYYPKAYYMYRIDNANSSVKSSQKYRTIVDEWHWIERKAVGFGTASRIREALKYDKLRSYWWNCQRLDDKACKSFCAVVYEELITEFVCSDLIQRMPWDLREMFETVYENAAVFQLEKDGKMDLKISVIIPAYNVQDYIGECVESILRQDIKEIEIICIDDCSTDDTLKILEQYAKNYKCVKVYKNDQNAGLAKTRNVGIKEAAGDYLLFVDGDDILQSGAVGKMINQLQKYHADIMMFDAECQFDLPELYDKALADYYHREVSYAYSTGRDILSRMIINNDLCDSACLMLIKSSWLREAGIWFEEGKIYEDCMFITDCLLKDCMVYHTNEKYYIYRIRNNSIMRSRMRAENVYSRIYCLKKIWIHMLTGNYTFHVENALLKWSNILYYSLKKIRSELSIIEEVRLREMRLRPSEKQVLQQAEKEFQQIYTEELYEFVKEIYAGERYLIYGAGRWGRRLIDFLDSQGLFGRIESILVTSMADNQDSVYGIPVTGIHTYENINDHTVVIVAVRGDEQIKIKHLLDVKGFGNVVCLSDQIVRNFLYVNEKNRKDVLC